VSNLVADLFVTFNHITSRQGAVHLPSNPLKVTN